jgi:hypothetical protein
MSSGTDITALYSEFTDALTEVLAENAVGPARRGRLARAPLSRSTRITAKLDIFWRSKRHSKIGKPYRTSAIKTGVCSGQRCR